MKSLVILATVAFASVGFAADTLDGCGLGWQVTTKKTYTATTTRGTTNGVIPPTFGMTTGTMGCDKLEVGQNNKEAADYVATNFETLKSELAKGQGEYVVALADSFGCKRSAEAVGAQIQKNYSNVVAPAHNSTELFNNIRGEIQNICL